jgi:hypothetical protein
VRWRVSRDTSRDIAYLAQKKRIGESVRAQRESAGTSVPGQLVFY